jgi:hypothetical protein
LAAASAEVPVDGEGVVGVALRLEPDHRPLRDDADPDALLVEGLDDGQRPFTAQQKLDEERAGLVAPRLSQLGWTVGQAVERAALDAGVVPGRGQGHLQGQKGVGRRVDSSAQFDDAFTQHNAGSEITIAHHHRLNGTLQGRVDAVPYLITRPGDAACRSRDAAHHLVGIDVAECRCDRVLLLEYEPVSRSPSAPVQFDPRRENGLVRLGQAGVVSFEHDPSGRLGPVDGVCVAQPTTAVLEIGLEQERHLAGLAVTLANGAAQLAQPTLGPLLPEREGLIGELAGQHRVTRNGAQRQHRRGRVEIVGSQVERLLRRAHRVTELQALVPERVPDALGDLADVGAAPVHQQQIDVALGRELGAPIAPDRHQGEAVDPPDLGGEQLAEPRVHQVAVCPTQGHAGEMRLGEQRFAVESRSGSHTSSLRSRGRLRWRRRRALQCECAPLGRPM